MSALLANEAHVPVSESMEKDSTLYAINKQKIIQSDNIRRRKVNGSLIRGRVFNREDIIYDSKNIP